MFKNSFANICTSKLAEKAKEINVCLGHNPTIIHSQIDKLKKLEYDRLEALAEEQPEIFLPTDIDVTLDDLMEQNDNVCTDFNLNYDSPPGGCEHGNEQDIHVSYKLRKDRSYRTKSLYKHVSDAIHHMEC